MRIFSMMMGLLLTIAAQAQCPQSTVTININTDQYPQETSWKLEDLAGNILDQRSLAGQPQNTLSTYEVCVETGVCLVFTIIDSYGDGIISAEGFEVLLDGNVVVENTQFGADYSANLNCPPGTACNAGLMITEGDYQTSLDDHWYQFIPDSSGQFLISTCGNNTCDTKIWVYEYCTGVLYEDNQATALYDDNFGGCGEQAMVLGSMASGETYYIRIGDDEGDCPDDQINWSIHFEGEIAGCTDPNSCNYNPAATIDDGTCIPFGDPDCPQGPDLVLDQDILRTSMYLSTIESTDDCLIKEGCLRGYGQRDIIRFSTNIANIGELDYFIGLENADNGQFTFDNCHNHWHYDGYAEYLLYDQAGQEIPIGFKNGFCVIDLGCTTGSAKYICSNMGISAGCYDEYWAQLECQWIDITDIPDGDYTFVARVNWDNAPDALGRVEKDTLNNWAQSCITVDRSSGSITFTQNDDCPTFVDCAGTPYGSAQIDCEGNCGGGALMGDLNADASQGSDDLDLYAAGVVANDLTATTCNDLTDDGFVDIYDIALLASCLSYGTGHVHIDNGPHDHCQFPRDVLAINEAASLEIIDGIPNEYFDVGITNPESRVIGYQFEISGIEITNVENLMDPAEYDHQVMMDPLTKMILSFSSDTSFIERSVTTRPLVRIYYSEQVSAEICIENIVGIINTNLESVPPTIEGPCLFVTANHTANLSGLTVMPNPTRSTTRINWDNSQKVYGWELTDIHGRILEAGKLNNANQLDFDLSALAGGLYFVKFRTSSGLSLVKLVKQ